MRVFIGHDGAEPLASVICAKSILRRTDTPVEMFFLQQSRLRTLGLYARDRDPLASTEFTYTRFLVPALCGYEGWALFVDADFLFQADVQQLWSLRDDRYAVQVVHHQYTPTEETKMGGVAQTSYPRKNWSSLILWQCGHIANRVLSPQIVNTQPGAYLHRFHWLADQQIGSLPQEWNWLEPMGESGTPRAIHYTRGIPGIHPGAFAFTEAWEEEVRACT